MGASVSVGSNLPPTLTEAQVKEICGESYNPNWFQAFQDDTHHINSADLTNLISSKVEREVLLLYFTYCPTGRMKNSAFFALCRECKLLGKSDFSIQKAEKIFDANLGKHEKPEVRTICYRTFRYHCLPDIAPIKGWIIDKLLKRLSECEAVIEDKNEIRKARVDVEATQDAAEEYNEKVTSKDCLEGVGKSLNLGSMFGASQHNAVVKIQSISRRKNSQNEAKRVSMVRTKSAC